MKNGIMAFVSAQQHIIVRRKERQIAIELVGRP